MFLMLQVGISGTMLVFRGVVLVCPWKIHRYQPRTTHHWYLSMSKVFFFACVPWCGSLSQSVRTKLPKDVPSEVMVGCRWLFWPVWAQLPNLCAKRPVPRASMWPTAFSAPWWMIPEGFWVGMMRNPLESVASFGILFGFWMDCHSTLGTEILTFRGGITGQYDEMLGGQHSRLSEKSWKIWKILKRTMFCRLAIW